MHLAEALAAQGAEVALLATNTRAPVEAAREPQRELGFPVYGMPDRVDLNGLGYARLARYAARIGLDRRHGSRSEILRNVLAYARFFDRLRHGVIHVQHPLERCTYARLVRKLERLEQPLVVTAHSLFGEHEDQTIHEVMAPNLRAADRVIAVSEHIADQATVLGVEPRRISVIRSGVDTQRFSPREKGDARRRLQLARTDNVVLFVGNLEPRKQVDVLLRAIASLKKKVPELRLLVVGSGESAGVQDQTARLIRLTQELGLEPGVRFMGRLSETELLDAYAAADVFALPSSSEAQGIVALEAMACGLTVVASAVGGLLGTIEDGATGFLVQASDVDALAEKLQEVLGDPQLRQRIGTAARRAVEQQFTWAKAAESTLDVYREVAQCA
jgi:glycosyltransferase involved in cell wall biosynthesis